MSGVGAHALELEKALVREEDWALFCDLVDLLLNAGYTPSAACESAHLLLRAKRRRSSDPCPPSASGP